MLMNWLIVGALVVLTGFNIYYLFYFKSRKNGKIKRSDNYYKLDAKIELQKYMAIGLITVASIFGYSKFSDLSDNLKRFENISSDYSKLSTDYAKLKAQHEELQEAIKEMTESFSQLEIYKKDIEMLFLKQNQKINEATRQIPEANIKVLTKQLIEINIRNAGISTLIEPEIDMEDVSRELIRSRELLKSVGYSSDEIEEIINKMKQKYNWIK